MTYKYMLEDRVMKKKTPEKEYFVLDLDDDEHFPPLLTKQTGIIYNKMLSCVPCVGSFSGSILTWDLALVSTVVTWAQLFKTMDKVIHWTNVIYPGQLLSTG